MTKFQKELVKTVLIVIVFAVAIIGNAKHKEYAYKQTMEYKVSQLKENQIGYHVWLETDTDRYISYLLLTPRGYERVEGDHNLQHSLEVYEENGTFGKQFKDMTIEEAQAFLDNYPWKTRKL